MSQNPALPLRFPLLGETQANQQHERGNSATGLIIIGKTLLAKPNVTRFVSNYREQNPLSAEHPVLPFTKLYFQRPQ